MAIQITFVKVKSGEGLLAIAGRVAPTGITAAQKSAFAQAIAVTNGITLQTVLYVNRILMIDSSTVPLPAGVSYNASLLYNDATQKYDVI